MDAFIYDHVRTPRGRGRATDLSIPGGALQTGSFFHAESQNAFKRITRDLPAEDRSYLFSWTAARVYRIEGIEGLQG